jgi:hypothetical protein
MLLDLKFSIGTLGIGSGTFIAGLYGMNLKNFIEESDLGFLGVSAWAFVFSAIICVYGLHKLRRMQRLTMWGESGGAGKKGWRSPEQGGGQNHRRPLPQALNSDSRLPGMSPHHPAASQRWPPLQTIGKDKLRAKR